MRVEILPSVANGKVSAPPSKSMAHRLLICAALAEGVSRIRGISDCDDARATVDCLRAFGAEIDYDGCDVAVKGVNMLCVEASEPLCCRESGSTLRFLIPIALLCGNEVHFCGAKRLFERPLDVYEELCRNRGMTLRKETDGIAVRGPLCGGEFSLRGDVSSQFITGLLLALPLCDGDSRINITTKTESRSYIDMTLSAMAAFGVSAVWESEQTLYIKGGQRYSPKEILVEGDFSGAAFTEALGLLGGRVEVLGLSEDSLQGDKVYREHFAALSDGAPVISLLDCPDLGPILFALAAEKGGARFTDTRRLRIKESDRAAAMAAELRKFGAEVVVEENEVTVKRSKLHAPTEVLCGHNDHRIVMALATLCTVYGGVIDGAEAVKKSYPEYFEDICSLGIKARIYEA